ncbi:MAG TPA: amino acid adenylation domain-containing protein, partial [Pseudonocardiaceae bacterium]
MLFDSGYGPLASRIVDYLVDAGHMVYVLGTGASESEQWQGRHEHDFAVVGPEDLPALALDYHVDLADGPGLPAWDGAPEQVVLRLTEVDGVLFAQCELRSDVRTRLLARRRCTSTAGVDPDGVREALAEACVDSLIALARGEEGAATVPLGEQQGNLLDEFHRFERGARELTDRARAAERDDQFHIADLVESPLEGSLSGTLDYPLSGRQLGVGDLEFLCLYLQFLVNARRSGTYSYDLDTAEGVVRKHVYLSPDLRSDDLERQLSLECYQLVRNRFYDFSSVFRSVSDPRVLVVHGDPGHDVDPGVLTLIYRPRDGVLRIRQTTGLPFFTHLRDHLDAYFSSVDRFTAGELDLDALTALPPELHRRFVDEPNRTDRPFAADQPIHRFIEQQAARTPDATALLCRSTRLSYQQLNEAANRLAHLVRNRYGVERGELIALYLDRTEHLVVSVLAALKLGCGYVPLDLESPVNRTTLILSGSRPVLVLSDTAHRDRLDGAVEGLPVLAVDADETRQHLAAQPCSDLDVPVSGADLAYVIYTSGTTGTPKGVAVEHRNFVNIATDIAECLDFRPDDRMLAVTTVAFDISTLEILMPLMYGGSLVLAGRADLLDTEKLVHLIEQVGVTVVQATPSLWHLILQRLDGRKLPVRALCGGEALNPQLAAQLVDTVDECWNVYGPTETTVWSTRHRLTGGAGCVPIGRPLANTRCYVLDERMHPLPPGVIGELYIGGAGVARGYLNDPELTARRFLADPMSPGAAPDRRVYRTGDLVRYLPSGELEFIGRNDFQIKLRGHRIELGEIESVLTGYPGIDRSVVVVCDPAGSEGDEGRYLAAYYAAAEPVDESLLRDHLAAALPDYMVPAVLVHLTELPLNANGKVDRRALPDPEQFRTGGHVPPATELEARLCALWEETLGRGTRGIGVTDDFFQVGGNSILGIRLVNRINSELGTDLKIRDLFREKTIRNLVPLVKATAGDFAYQEFVLDSTDRDGLYEPFPLTNVQQTYYLGRFNNFELSDLSTHVYTEFCYAEIDHERLERAFNRLVERHLALRTVFTDGQQRFLPEVPYYRIEFHELHSQEELEQLRHRYSHKSYDPECFPLFDVVLSRLDGVYRLHLSFDAIVVDMTSFGILFEEWIRLYQDPEHVLPDIGISYRDYVLQYARVRESDLLVRAQEYWQNKVDSYNLDMNLPLRARPSAVGKPFFRRRSRVIPAPVWKEVTNRCLRYGISPTALILEIYGRVLSRWSGQEQLCVNLTLFNRLPLHPDINSVIGDFTVLELFDYRLEDELGIAAKLRRVHDELLQDIDNNLFDGVDVQRLLKLHHNVPVNKIVAPVVLTSTLGNGDAASLFELPLDNSYLGVDYAISQTSQVWLDNKAYETAEGFVAEWDYVDQLFDESVIAAMHDAYCWLIERVAELDWEADPFPVLRTPDADLALIEAANSHRQPVSDHTLVSLYESRLDEPGFRDRIAVIDTARGASFRYGELYRDSQVLAEVLLAEVLPPTTDRRGDVEPVAILAEKGYTQVVATLGIMKAGAAYVPMNVEWPVGRVDEILTQAGVRTVLVSRAQAARPEVQQRLADSYRLLVVEDALAGGSADGEALPLPEVSPDDVAYVIFTSGSTGKPKGVTISHRGAVNTIVAVNARFGVGPADRVLALSELSFDLSVYDIFGVLAAGGTVVFPAQERTKDPAHWVDLVERHGVTLWNSVPQLAGLLADE